MKKLLIILHPFLKLVKGKVRQQILKRSNILITLIKIAFLKRLSKSKKKVSVKTGAFTLSSPDYNTLGFLLKEKFADEQYYFKETCDEPVIFDCGASIGISVLYFKCLYPDCEIYAFEPNPVAFDFLQENVNKNKLKNVHCYNLALSDKNGLIDFFIPQKNSLINAKTSQNDADQQERIRVQTKPLSDFLLTFTAVHLVKIDVEGSELEIMHDLNKEVLARKIVKRFIIEYHCSIHPDKKTIQNFLAYFTNNGYLYKVVAANKDASESDKLIVAWLPDDK